MVYIVMGVSGCGKSTIGKLLAEGLTLPFYDGDDFHPQSNIDKMASGQALNDGDREPWLKELAHHINNWNQKSGAVLACSALKQSYRDLLNQFGGVTFIHLTGSKELITQRMEARDHFMPPELLKSQFTTLEAPTDSWDYSIELDPSTIITLIKERIHVNTH